MINLGDQAVYRPRSIVPGGKGCVRTGPNIGEGGVRCLRAARRERRGVANKPRDTFRHYPPHPLSYIIVSPGGPNDPRARVYRAARPIFRFGWSALEAHFHRRGFYHRRQILPRAYTHTHTYARMYTSSAIPFDILRVQITRVAKVGIIGGFAAVGD